MAQTRIRPEQVRLDLDWSFAGHVAIGEDGVIAATRLLDIDGITTGFGAVLTPSMGIDSPLFYGLYTRLETEVAAITVTDAISLFVEDPIKGAGSTMTNLYGLCIEDLTQGTARNWAVCIRGDNPIVWGADTNLYRGAANILKTDDSFQATRVFTADGLVGSPAHSFISDPDTGLYRLGANRLGIATAGAFAVEIDATGQVGIGGTPNSPFKVFTTLGTPDWISVILDSQASGAGNFILFSDGVNYNFAIGTYHNVTGNFVFYAGRSPGVAGTAVMSVQQDGGVTMPGLKRGANQGAAGAAANELWVDSADESIKRGV